MNQAIDKKEQGHTVEVEEPQEVLGWGWEILCYRRITSAKEAPQDLRALKAGAMWDGGI